jgi:hypothetical protein
MKKLLKMKKITIFYKKIEKNWRFTFDVKNGKKW